MDVQGLVLACEHAYETAVLWGAVVGPAALIVAMIAAILRGPR